MKHNTFTTLALLLAAGTAAPFAAAQEYPTQPVTLIVNFPPGGITDLAARALANAMSAELKQNVVVQNKGGAGGAIGLAAIAAAPKNGYTVGFSPAAALTTLPQIRTVPYRIDSVDYICRAFDEPVYMLVTPQSRFKTAKALVDFAKANPEKVDFATVGAGSLPHLAALDFANAAGVKMTHIPYQGEGPAVTDLLGGHVDVYFGTSAVATAQNLRRLAVAAPKRVPASPDTPTLTELGYPVVRSIMGGLIAPSGIDQATRRTLENACAAASRTPQYRGTMEQLKVAWAYSEGAEFKSLILAESARNRLVLREAKLLGGK